MSDQTAVAETAKMTWPEKDAQDVRIVWNFPLEVLVMYVDGQEEGETWVDGAIEDLVDQCEQYQRGDATGWPRVTEDFTGDVAAHMAGVTGQAAEVDGS